MKYYIYLAEAKIDMLFPQVPTTLRETVSAEVGFNIGVVSGSIGSEVKRFDSTVARVTAIERYLSTNKTIGTSAEPSDWFAGYMSARTIGLWTQGGAVFFVGWDGDSLVVLGGSARHLIGGELSTHDGPPYSHLAPMMEALEALVVSDTDVTRAMPPPERLRQPGNHPEMMDWPELLRSIAESSRGLRQDVHFVARVLASSPGVILGTPLYVASGRAA